MYINDDEVIAEARRQYAWEVLTIEASQLEDALATWHTEFVLTEVLRSHSLAGNVNNRAVGVYMLFDRSVRPSGALRYIGMSNNLSRRLYTYASGKSGNPVNAVTNQHLETCSSHERKLYYRLPAAEQQAWRKEWMRKRDFLVKVSHTQTLEDAQKLEKALIRAYLYLGVPLWNLIQYRTTPPFPAPKKEVA